MCCASVYAAIATFVHIHRPSRLLDTQETKCINHSCFHSRFHRILFSWLSNLPFLTVVLSKTELIYIYIYSRSRNDRERDVIISPADCYPLEFTTILTCTDTSQSSQTKRRRLGRERKRPIRRLSKLHILLDFIQFLCVYVCGFRRSSNGSRSSSSLNDEHRAGTAWSISLCLLCCCCCCCFSSSFYILSPPLPPQFLFTLLCFSPAGTDRIACSSRPVQCLVCCRPSSACTYKHASIAKGYARTQFYTEHNTNTFMIFPFFISRGTVLHFYCIRQFIGRRRWHGMTRG